MPQATQSPKQDILRVLRVSDATARDPATRHAWMGKAADINDEQDVNMFPVKHVPPSTYVLATCLAVVVFCIGMLIM